MSWTSEELVSRKLPARESSSRYRGTRNGEVNRLTRILERHQEAKLRNMGSKTGEEDGVRASEER